MALATEEADGPIARHVEQLTAQRPTSDSKTLVCVDWQNGHRSGTEFKSFMVHTRLFADQFFSHFVLIKFVFPL